MIPLVVAICFSAFILAISILCDLNWRGVKVLVRSMMPAKAFTFIRLIQGTAAFIYASFLMYVIFYFPFDMAIKVVAISLAGIVSSVVLGILVYKRGTRLSVDETVEEKDLRSSIREDVEMTVKSIVSQMDKSLVSIRDEVRGEVYNLRGQVNELIEGNEALLKRFEGKLDQVNKIVKGYNIMVETYREESRKREALALQIEEVTRLEEEYRRKLESLSQASLDVSMTHELAYDKAILTQADGMASRRKGNSAQKKVAELLRDLGFEVEEYYGVGLPDLIIKWLKRKVAIGAHKAFTLSRDTIRQRTISAKIIKAEINAAKKYKLPLVIIVTNLKNGRKWAELAF